MKNQLLSKGKYMIAFFIIIAYFQGTEAQTYIVDSTFVNDTIIHPFGPNDTLYSLKISGSLTLNSDTSLARIIVGNEDSVEYMVFESYPLITEYYSYSFLEKGDETKYLNKFTPKYLKILLINSTFVIESLNDSESFSENLDSLQFDAKQTSDIQKVILANQNIVNNGWDWTAGGNSLLDLFYMQKVLLFGSKKYNLKGYDMHVDGVFCAPPSNYYSNNNSQFIQDFDWRSKHAADNPLSFYYNTNEKGWNTGFRAQGNCGTCTAFGTLASLEALTNIYFNPQQFQSHLNLNYSEQELFCCINGTCSGGSFPEDALDYLIDEKIHDEGCYEYNTTQINGNCCVYCPDNPPAYEVKIQDKIELIPFWFNTVDTLKSWLIRKGPLIVWVEDMNHVMSLVGYKNEEESNDIIWIFKDSNPVTDGGFREMKLDPSNIEEIWAIVTPITVTYPGPINQERIVWDNDMDGYYNWGIYNKGSFVSDCDPQMDWNDYNNRIGPADDNFYGQDVQPTMEVYLGDPTFGRRIENKGFCYFHDNDLDTNGNLTIIIKNTGTAQLNLVQLNPVLELVDDDNCFSLTPPPPDYKICHLQQNNTTEFEINFSCTGQDVKIAKYKIDIHECDEDIYEDFEFILVYYTCSQASGLWTIHDPNAIIDGIHVETRDILIESNSTLTITGTLGMEKEGDIFIKPGASLIIDGGSITKLCSENWNGIDVWGDASLSQYPISNQGYLKIVNEGCIEYAETGVQVTRLFNGVPSSNWNGGVVHCNEAIFKNNQIDAIFYSYNNFDPNSLTKVPNRSRFLLAEFINNKICDKDIHVGLQNVDGIFFRGCDFRNSVDKVMQNCQTIDKGTGIYSFNSGFRIIDECTEESTPCGSTRLSRFENLKYGIYALNAEFNEFIGIDTAVFYNTYRGIYMNLVDYPEIVRNQFIYDEDYDYLPTYDESYGLDLEYCGSFIVEQNVFTNSSPVNDMLGLQVLNAGPNALEIYNNSINGFNTGITAAGNNRATDGTGLCIKCNDFVDCLNDIYITDEGGVGGFYGIALLQGDEAPQPPPNQDPDPTYAAGNNFSDLAGDFTNYTNLQTCYPIKYTHHGIFDNTLYKLIPDPCSPPQPTTHIDLSSDIEVEYNSKSEACPNNFVSGINISTEMSLFNSETAVVSAYKDTLSMFVDGGDTESLNMDVQLSFPDDAMEVRQDLLDNSPYLSDTVMLTAIEKENVLQNAMIRDVLVANPQSAKSPKIISAINNRNNPMPDYMMGEILQGQAIYGSKELIEQELSHHKTIRDRSFDKLLRFYLSDTLSTSASIDSITLLLHSRNCLEARYKLAMHYLNQHDSLNSFTTIDSIPSEFLLNAEEIIIHGLYLDLLENIWDINNDTSGIDSVHIADLYQFVNTPALPGLYARNILIFADEFSFEEQIYLPNSLKVSPIWQSQDTRNTHSNLKIFPNPAHDYFTIEYSIDEYTKDTWIIISDIAGKHIKSLEISSLRNQIIVPVQNLPSGIYIIRLVSNGNILESNKISILR